MTPPICQAGAWIWRSHVRKIAKPDRDRRPLRFARCARRVRKTAAPRACGAAVTDPVTPYKADRLSSSRGETILDTPGQTTVLTRQMLDDMNATSLRDAMRSTAGVTIGR